MPVTLHWEPEEDYRESEGHKSWHPKANFATVEEALDQAAVEENMGGRRATYVDDGLADEDGKKRAGRKEIDARKKERIADPDLPDRDLEAD